MPFSSKPDFLKGTGYKTVQPYESAQPGAFKKILRFPGFSRVRVLHDIYESRVAIQPGESDENYHDRITMALIACNLADNHNGKLEGVHTLNRAFSNNQLQKLEESLNRPFHEVVQDVIQKNTKVSSRLNREIDRYPGLLVELCVRMPIKTSQDLAFISSHCHHYLVHGEGLQLLEKNKFPGVDEQQMGRIIPEMPADKIDNLVVGMAASFMETCKRSDGTKFGLELINNIQWANEKQELSFNSDSPEHRCLVVMQTMAMSWQAYCEGHVQGVNDILLNDAADPGLQTAAEEKVKALLAVKQPLGDVWIAVSHNVMLGSKDFRANFDTKNYQQVVLRGGNDNRVYWNSDNVQPRMGWVNTHRFDSVTLPK